MGEFSVSGWLMKVRVSGFVGRVSDATGSPSLLLGDPRW